MNASTLLRQVIRDGGGTYAATADGRTFTPYRPGTGYFVGRHPGTFATVWSGYRFATETIEREARAIVARYPGALVGLWAQARTDGPGYTLHIDPVACIPDLTAALEFGRRMNQQAVWDIAAGKEITLR